MDAEDKWIEIWWSQGMRLDSHDENLLWNLSHNIEIRNWPIMEGLSWIEVRFVQKAIDEGMFETIVGKIPGWKLKIS